MSQFSRQELLECGIERATESYHRSVEQLKTDIEWLIRDLQKASNSCDRILAGEDTTLNSCGVIQGMALRIDGRCATLPQMVETINTLKYLASKKEGE